MGAGVSLFHDTVQALRPACGSVMFLVTCAAESPEPYPMFRAALAADTASSSLICPTTVTTNDALSLAAFKLIVAVRVTCALPIDGRWTRVPSSAISEGLPDDQLIVQLLLPLVGNVRSPDTLDAESLPEYPICSAALAAATAS